MFFLGLLLRRAYIDRDEAAARWSMAMVPAVIVCAFIMGGMAFPVDANKVLYFPPLVLSLSMALPPIVFLAVLKWRPAMPQPMLWLGTISYSLYLFQDLWLILLPKWLSPGQFPLLFVVLTCVLATLTAAAIYWLVERPMLALGKRVMRARSPVQPVAPATA
jgi:peptidoglycan/LPS O-acetylase OafA/YrhL